MSRVDGHGMRVGDLLGYPPLVPRRNEPVTSRYYHLLEFNELADAEQYRVSELMRAGEQGVDQF